MLQQWTLEEMVLCTHTSSSIYVHFSCGCCGPISVRSLLRPFHYNHVLDAPLARDSLSVCISFWGTDCWWLDHSSIHRVDGLSISSSVSCMKLLLDFIGFFGSVWPCSGCLVSFTCSPYPFVQQHSLLLGCVHPVVEQQVSFNTGLTLCACADLSHTGYAYSAVEWLRDIAVVIMVAGFQPHFEL